MSNREFKSVHDAHCCKVHGCKYGHDMLAETDPSVEMCPVVAGKEQGIMCELCEWEEENEGELKNIIKEYLKENIELRVLTNRAGYGDHLNSKDIEVVLLLEGEKIASADFTVVEGKPERGW